MRNVVRIGVLLAVLLALAGALTLFDEASDSPTKPACMVRSQTCHWTSDNRQWRVSLMAPVPPQDRESDGLFRISVSSSAAAQRLTAVLSGETMYMGEYPVALHRDKTTADWSATFVPPVCSVDSEMTWRIEFLNGNRRVAMPVKLVFRAHAG